MRKILSALLLSFMLTSCFHKETPLDNRELQVKLSSKLNKVRGDIDRLSHQWDVAKNEKIECSLCRSKNIDFMRDRYGDISIVCKDCGDIFDQWDSETFRYKRVIQQELEDAKFKRSLLIRGLEEVIQRSNGETNYVFDFWSTVLLVVVGMIVLFIFNNVFYIKIR